jgi:hypothetical protein
MYGTKLKKKRQGKCLFFVNRQSWIYGPLSFLVDGYSCSLHGGTAFGV